MKKILMLKLYHCIYELYKLQRIFLSRRSIMCTSYLKKDIVFRMRGSNTYSMAKILCALEDISKCQIIRILRQKFWQQQQFMTATTQQYIQLANIKNSILQFCGVAARLRKLRQSLKQSTHLIESFSIFHNIILVKARRQYYLLL